MKATFGNCKPKLKVSVDFSDSSQYYTAYMYKHAYIRLYTPLSTPKQLKQKLQWNRQLDFLVSYG